MENKFFLTFIILGAFLVFLMIVSMWVIYKKAGKPGWGSLIPLYNFYLLCDIIYHKGWLMILFFVPIVGEIFLLLLIFQLAKSFGKGTGFGLGLLFLPVLFFPILAFGNAQYKFRTIQHVSVSEPVSVGSSSVPESASDKKDDTSDISSDSKLNILLRPTHSPSANSSSTTTNLSTPSNLSVNNTDPSNTGFVNAIHSVEFIPSNGQESPLTSNTPSTIASPNYPNQSGEISTTLPNELNSNVVQPNLLSSSNSNLPPVGENPSMGEAGLETNSLSSNNSLDFVAPVVSNSSFASQIPEVAPVTPVVDPIPSITVQENIPTPPVDFIAPIGNSTPTAIPSAPTSFQNNTGSLGNAQQNSIPNSNSPTLGSNTDVSLDFVAPILPTEIGSNPSPNQEVAVGNSFMANPVNLPPSPSMTPLENPSPIPAFDRVSPLTPPVAGNSSFSPTMPTQPVGQTSYVPPVTSFAPLDSSQTSSTNDGSNPMAQ